VTQPIHGRPIKQIEVSADPQGGADVLYALCEDNSLWCRLMLTDRPWEQITPIPLPQ
jgi:hypothetical protein